MEWFLAFGGTILKCLSFPIKWLIEKLRFVKQEKKEAERDVTVWFEKYKDSLKQQLKKETDTKKRQALEDELKQLDAGERAYYKEMLERTLERSGLPPYGELVAKGEFTLEPADKAKLSEAIQHLYHLPPTNIADDFIASAAANYALERYEEALDDINKVLQLRPDDPAALSNRGATYAEMERYDEALTDFNRAIELRPDYEMALSNRGITYSKLDRYGEALTDVNRAIELIPDYPAAVYNKSCIFSLMHKPKDAIAFLEKAIALDSVYRQKATVDSDFDNIRDDPRFQKLIKGD